MNCLKKSLLIALTLSSMLSLPVLAADKAAGEQKSSNCVGCHGAQGKSSNNQIPNLAAQQEAYIINQLKAFKSAERKNSMMEAMAKNLSDADMENLAAYFSSLAAVKAGADATLAKTGQTKAAMCLGCHGEKATGNGQIPRLVGQQPDYLVTQLSNFKAATRKSGHMQAIANTLSEDDMKALAAYFGSL